MEGEKISNSRRVIFDEGGYKIQSMGLYNNSPDWSTIITLDPDEVDSIAQFKEGIQEEQEEKREVIHCQRCSNFNPPGSQSCESCDRDITGDPTIKMPK